MRTREEHLEWCKERARKYLDAGDLLNAVTSMGSDLDKHPEMGCNPALLMVGAMYAQTGNTADVRRWIEGFR
jgi:hypothetical protein